MVGRDEPRGEIGADVPARGGAVSREPRRDPGAGASAEAITASAATQTTAQITRRVADRLRPNADPRRRIIRRAPQPQSGSHVTRAIPARYGHGGPYPREAEHDSSRQTHAGRSRHPELQPVITLTDTYQLLARPWSHEELTNHYRDADRSGAGGAHTGADVPSGGVALVATAFPAAATVTVAIHALHVLPESGFHDAGERLLTTVARNAAYALHRCHRALELDGSAHGYSSTEWLPLVYDTASALLESARRSDQPPAMAQVAQDAVSWLARTVVELDSDSPETPEAFAEVLARLLAVGVFARIAAVHSSRTSRMRGSGWRAQPRSTLLRSSGAVHPGRS